MSTTQRTPEARRNKPEFTVVGDMEQIVIDALAGWMIAQVGARLREHYGHDGNKGATSRSTQKDNKAQKVHGLPKGRRHNTRAV